MLVYANILALYIYIYELDKLPMPLLSCTVYSSTDSFASTGRLFKEEHAL